MNEAVRDLIERSNRLGADPANTNYAGGNTSAKGTETDPVTGEPVELCWVKGSGGDLGTLKPEGLAVLRLDRMRALVDVYPGIDREDEMVAAFDYCLHGKGGAAPSIDTAMHGLVDAAHVDHLHPDSGIAIATAADGEALTSTIFGDKVVWVPWRRPGFQLGLDIAAIKEANPQAIGTILGGHGITAWGDTSAEAEANSLWIIKTAADYIAAHGKADPFGGVRAGFEALPEAERAAKAAALAPTLRAIASQDRPMVGHFTDADVVLDFLASEEAPALAELGTSCPDHFLRTKVKPLLLDLPADASIEDTIARLETLHEEYRADYAGYYERNATPESPAIRGADPLIILIPGVGMFSYGANKQTARVAGEFYVNAINVMRGAEALSTWPRSSASSTGRWRRPSCSGCPSPSRSRPGSRWSRVRRPASARPSRRGSRPRAPASRSPTWTWPRRRRPPPRSAAPTWPSACSATSPLPSRCRPRWTPPCWPSAASTSSSTTPACRSPSRCWRPPRPTGTCSTT